MSTKWIMPDDFIIKTRPVYWPPEFHSPSQMNSKGQYKGWILLYSQISDCTLGCRAVQPGIGEYIKIDSTLDQSPLWTNSMLGRARSNDEAWIDWEKEHCPKE